jgi:hypothetical protein
MYVDKLDGVIEEDYFTQMRAEWRTRQDEVRQSIQAHRMASRTYFDEGIQLLELARKAGELFRKQDPEQHAKLLEFVLSNSVWKHGKLTVTFNQPFDLLAVTTAAQPGQTSPELVASGLSDGWLPETNAVVNSLSMEHSDFAVPASVL